MLYCVLRGNAFGKVNPFVAEVLQLGVTHAPRQCEWFCVGWQVPSAMIKSCSGSVQAHVSVSEQELARSWELCRYKREPEERGEL